MNILLDHCADWRLGRSLPSHQVKSSQEMGWQGLKNGKLLAAEGASFEVLPTVDQNIKAEQNLSTLPISVIVLIAKSNRLRDLVPLIPSVETVLITIRRGQLIEIRASGVTINI